MKFAAPFLMLTLFAGQAFAQQQDTQSITISPTEYQGMITLLAREAVERDPVIAMLLGKQKAAQAAVKVEDKPVEKK